MGRIESLSKNSIIDYLGINQNLSEIVESERKFLINLFEIKEKIDEQLNDLESKGLETIEKELFENLDATKTKLFKEFFLRYCANRYLLDYASDNDEALAEFNNIDKTVRIGIGYDVFLSVDKKDIFKFMDFPLDFPVSREIIDRFISGFLKEYKDDIEKKLETPVFLDGFLAYHKDFIIDNLFYAFSKNENNVNLDKMFDTISNILIIFLKDEEVKTSYAEFIKKELNDDDSQIMFEFDDSDELLYATKPYIKQLIDATFSESFVLDNFDFDESSVDNNGIVDSVLSFIKSHLDWDSIAHADDGDDFVKQIYSIYLDESSYAKWIQSVIDKVKLPISVENIPFKAIDESENIQKYIGILKENYPKAKNYLGKIGVQEWKTLKSQFITQYKKDFVKKIETELATNQYKDLSLVQLYTMMFVYLAILNKIGLDITADFEHYIKDILEGKFKESHDKTVEKEEEKEKQKKKQKQKESKKETTKEMKNNANLQAEQNNNIVVVNFELPEKMIEQLKEYFSSDDLDRDLLRSLRKTGGFYKTGWFSKFGVDEKFFEILDENGFVCDDESVDNSDNSSDVIDYTDKSTDKSTENSGDVVETNDELSQLSKLIEKIGNTEDIDEKVEYYIQAFELFYDFKDKEYIKTQMLKSIKSDNRVLKGVDFVLYKIINGQKEEIKTSRMSKRKRYFVFDLGHNTGYRIVIQDQKGSNRRMIVDFVDHDTYSDRIPTYYYKF